MELNNLKYTKGSRDHKEKVVGRGYGSGMGKRSTRGQKGQNARKSGNVRQGFEGGQTPLYRRIPKIGFNNENFANKYEVITTDQLSRLNVSKIDREVLVKNQLISKNSKLPIKIIASKNKLASAINVEADKFSKGALEMIEKAKGSVLVKNQETKTLTKPKTKKVPAKKAVKK